jgi:hypothetical protein
MTWNSEKHNNPEGILITMPERFFDEYPGGEDTFRRIIEALEHLPTPVWGNTISSIPKLPVVYCYICFRGYIQYRLNIMEFRSGESREYHDGGIVRVFKNKNWVDLTGPVVKAPDGMFPKKGFQGFRYVKKLF